LEELKRDTILANLQILNDEPILNPLFNFKEFGDQLSKILLDKTTPTPFSIGLDGEWGSGKSTLLLYLENLIKERIKKDNEKVSWKIICFNAWKYEKLDPIGSLMQIISNEYENKEGNEKWKEIVKNYGLLALSTGLKVTLGIDVLTELEKTKETISNTVKELKTVSGCSIDAALDTLLAIKLLFNSKNSLFLVSADFRMLSYAWELKYKQINIHSKIEAAHHLDKIFQLVLSLPHKADEDILSFISNYISSPTLKSLINIGCSKNPRKIKKILNLIYFNSKLMPNSIFATAFPLLVIFCIVSVRSKLLVEKLKDRPSTIFLIIAAASNYRDYNEFYNSLYPALFENSRPAGVKLGKNASLGFQSFPYFPAYLEIMVKDESIFHLFVEASKHYPVTFTDNWNGELPEYMDKYQQELNYLMNILI
jgi:hypothetical protein